MTKRSQAREVAFQVLYQDDLNPRNNPADADAFIRQRILMIAMAEFVDALPPALRRARPQIDTVLSQEADDWMLDQSAGSNCDALHQSVYELLTDTEFAGDFFSLPDSITGLVGFCRSLVAGTRKNRSQIDAALNATADNWTLDRMAATDRNILRLAAFELLHTDTPRAVAIDEAIELAKRFGAAQSAQFVNGILDRLVPSA